MKKLVVLCFLLIVSCDYLNLEKKEKNTSDIIAIVNTDKLFREDLKGIFPKKINKQDSLVLINSYIQDWAIKKLLIKKASNNNSVEDIENIEIFGRCQKYRDNILLDVGHNSLSAKSIANYLSNLNRKITLIYNS